MANHDSYGKELMSRAAGFTYVSQGPSVHIDYGTPFPARIDGVVANRVAVEVESRVSKQIRGALMDLLWHKAPKKLLVLLPVHASNPVDANRHCETILRRWLPESTFRVVLTAGSGFGERFDEDVPLVRKALRELG